MSATALGLAWRSTRLSAIANEVARDANRLSEAAVAEAGKANSLAERSIRVSKLPSVEGLFREFLELLPGLRDPVEMEAVRKLMEMRLRVRLIGRDSLYLPFRTLTSVARRVAEDSQHNLSGARQSEAEARRKKYLPEAINAVVKAFEDFINN